LGFGELGHEMAKEFAMNIERFSVEEIVAVSKQAELARRPPAEWIG
jgi:hypothetical protein